MRKGLVMLSTICLLSGVTVGQTVVTGSLLDQNGKPMQVANVELLVPGTIVPLDTVGVSPDGRYTIPIDSSGIWFLRFAGVSHRNHEVAVYIDKPGKIGIDVRLATYQYLDTISNPGIEGNFDKFDIANPLRMQKQPDGTFTAEIKTKADSIQYEIVGIAKDGRTVNGTEADHYVIDNTADYWSIMKPVNGAVHIVFDPAKLVESDRQVTVAFADSQSTAARLAKVYDEMQRNELDFQIAARAYRNSGGDMPSFRYNWSAETASLQKRIDAETNNLVRQALFLNYVYIAAMRAKIDYKYLEKAINDVPPSSIIWSLKPALYPLMLELYGIIGYNLQQYEDRFVKENPSRIAKSDILFDQFLSAKSSKDEKDAKKYYKILTEDYADTPRGRSTKENYSPTPAVIIGKPVPHFSISSLTDSSKTWTNNSFKGKYYMIDFWATWCGPCVGEMKYLQDAYSEFKNKNFTMLSISLDTSPEDVVRFRESKWPMPWHQAFAPGGWNNNVVTKFGVVGIPNPILVDPSGKVVAMGDELRGVELKATLAKFLDKKKE